MYLTSRFASSFTERVRSRGQAYFARGRVDIVAGDKEEVEAGVRGTDRYEVSLRIEGRELLVWCTCPYYENALCKHVWATMLAAERKGHLTGGDHLPTRLVMTDTMNIDEEDDEFQSPKFAHGLKPTPATWQRSIDPEESKPSAWRRHLESVNQSMKAFTDDQTRPWPTTRELFYIVDVRSTLIGNGLSVSLAWREMKRNGEWGKIKTTGLPTIRVSQLPEPDRQIVALLMGGREHYGYASQYSGAPERYRLFEPLDHTLMPMMCNTGRCRLLVSAAPQTRAYSKPRMKCSRLIGTMASRGNSGSRCVTMRPSLLPAARCAEAMSEWTFQSPVF